MKMLGDFTALLDDFRKVAQIAGMTLPAEAISFEAWPAPHTPSSLPNGKSAVYVFIRDGVCLKVGKVGSKSNARFNSQHYNPSSSNSNLAKSIVARQSEIGLSGLGESDVGEWIKAHVDRVNFSLSEECNIFTLSLLETFLPCRLQPIFEGFESQR